jgi:hypothetical protein
MKVDVEILEENAEEILETKIKGYMTDTKKELSEKIDIEEKKSEQYFNASRRAIENVIDPVRESRLQKIEEQQNQERVILEKKKHLVPKTTLFAAAEVTLIP